MKRCVGALGVGEQIAGIGCAIDPLRAGLRLSRRVFIGDFSQFRLHARELNLLFLCGGLFDRKAVAREILVRRDQSRTTLSRCRGLLCFGRIAHAPRSALKRARQFCDRTVVLRVRLRLFGLLLGKQTLVGFLALLRGVLLSAQLGGADSGEVGLKRSPHSAHRPSCQEPHNEQRDHRKHQCAARAV